MLHPRPCRAPITTVLALAVLTALPSAALAVDPTLEARLSRIERMLSERSLSDLVLQLQQLQQEVQELRGQVETQQYLLRQQGIEMPSSLTDEVPTFGQFDIDEREQEPVRALDPGLLALPAPETAGGGERELYREAFELLKERDYPAARATFSEMVERYPRGQFADNGRYWLGEIGYVTQDYAAAQREFNRLVSDYPQSSRVPAAMLKLGYVSYDQEEFDAARDLLEEVLRRFPETTEARLAQGRLDRMQRERQ